MINITVHHYLHPVEGDLEKCKHYWVEEYENMEDHEYGHAIELYMKNGFELWEYGDGDNQLYNSILDLLVEIYFDDIPESGENAKTIVRTSIEKAVSIENSKNKGLES